MDIAVLIVSTFSALVCLLSACAVGYMFWKAIDYYRDTKDKYQILHAVADDLMANARRIQERIDGGNDRGGQAPNSPPNINIPPPFDQLFNHVRRIIESSPDGVVPAGMLIQTSNIDELPQPLIEAFREVLGADVELTEHGLEIRPAGADPEETIDPKDIADNLRAKDRQDSSRISSHRCEFNAGIDADGRCPAEATEVVYINVPTIEDVEKMQNEDKKASEARRLEARLCCAEHAAILIGMPNQKGIAYSYPIREHQG